MPKRTKSQDLKASDSSSIIPISSEPIISEPVFGESLINQDVVKALRDIQTIQEREAFRPGYTVPQGLARLEKSGEGHYEGPMGIFEGMDAESPMVNKAYAVIGEPIGEPVELRPGLPETLLGYPIVYTDMVAKALGVSPELLEGVDTKEAGDQLASLIREDAEEQEKRILSGDPSLANSPMGVISIKPMATELQVALSAMRQGLSIPMEKRQRAEGTGKPKPAAFYAAEKKAKKARKTEKASRRRNNKPKPTNKANGHNKK